MVFKLKKQQTQNAEDVLACAIFDDDGSELEMKAWVTGGGGGGAVAKATTSRRFRQLERISSFFLLIIIVLLLSEKSSLPNTPEQSNINKDVSFGCNTKPNLVPNKPEQSNNNNTKTKPNLVLFNAVGRVGNLQYVLHSRKSHFTNQDWDCLVFMYVDEEKIADDQPELVSLRQEGCTIIRTPGVQWGVFLQYVAPPLVSNYEHIAVHLDDVFLPDRGTKPIKVPQLLEKMKKYDISTIQPSIRGDTHDTFTRGKAKCIEGVHAIETFVQIWTNDAWNCFYNMLHYKGGRGWCYDMCFPQECPNFQLALDHTMVGYHLEKARHTILQDNIVGLNLTFVEEKRIDTGEGGMYDMKNNDYLYVCSRLNCTNKDYGPTGQNFEC